MLSFDVFQGNLYLVPNLQQYFRPIINCKIKLSQDQCTIEMCFIAAIFVQADIIIHLACYSFEFQGSLKMVFRSGVYIYIMSSCVGGSKAPPGTISAIYTRYAGTISTSYKNFR